MAEGKPPLISSREYRRKSLMRAMPLFQMLTESICLLGKHRLENPKLLPCYHSYCSECIEANTKEDCVFACPQCQLRVHIPDCDADQLQDDYLYTILKEIASDGMNCVNCGFEGNIVEGVFQCQDCGDVICKKCKELHNKTMPTQNHKVVPIKDSKENVIEPSFTGKLYCKEHRRASMEPMVMNLYCEHCNVLACNLCALSYHSTSEHSCRNIDDIHDLKQKEMKAKIVKLSEINQHGLAVFSTLEQSYSKSVTEQSVLENEIISRAALLFVLIQKLKETKLAEVRYHYTNEHQSLQKSLAETKIITMRISSILQYAENFFEYSSKTDFLRHERQLEQNIQDYCKIHFEKEVYRSTLKIGDMKLRQAEGGIVEAIGVIMMKKKKLDSTGNEVKITSGLKEEPYIYFNIKFDVGFVFGITVTSEKEIIAVAGPSIYVYRADGKHKKTIDCPDLQNPWDITSNKDFIFIGDRMAVDYEKIVVVNKDNGEVKRYIGLPSHKTHSHLGLTADHDDDTIYISSYSHDAIYKARSTSVQARPHITEGENLCRPIYICTTHNGQLVVSNHGSHNIQGYNKKGGLLWQYSGAGEMKLQQPMGVCCDKRGNIYVAENMKHRLQVIANGIFKGSVKSEYFKNPFCITLDHEDNVICAHKWGSNIIKMDIWQKSKPARRK